jgi:NAD(P)-dependent dehydrogenase (short-subunit alcohol dehydrogenase family)
MTQALSRGSEGFTGKVALITGGGTGIGRAISLKFASEGADVAINYSRRAPAAEETAETARKLGVRAIAVPADITRDAEARRLVAETATALGRLDILVNNAGWTQIDQTEHGHVCLLGRQRIWGLPIGTRGDGEADSDPSWNDQAIRWWVRGTVFC